MCRCFQFPSEKEDVKKQLTCVWKPRQDQNRRLGGPGAGGPAGGAAQGLRQQVGLEEAVGPLPMSLRETRAQLSYGEDTAAGSEGRVRRRLG